MTTPADIPTAIALLRAGRLVAFPTETVYGLGADATSAAAVLRIYQVKGRPDTNPLIVHVAGESVAQRYAADWPPAAARLARRFWPGALTLVLPKHPSIVDEATAGLPTVGLRCPDHLLALELLRKFDGPVAAPSANRSTRVSPTTAQHVRDEFDDAVDMILDGGPCRVGIESTVLTLAEPAPRILRPGAVTREMIEAEIGPVVYRPGTVAADATAHSPGQQVVHYAPRATAYLFTRAMWPAVIARCQRSPAPVAILGFSPPPEQTPPAHCRMLPMPNTADDYARLLYARLRQVDAQSIDTVYIESPPTTPLWTAILDRLRRATRPFPAR